MKKYLVLAGNIGAGKSTLVSLLSNKLGYLPYFEPVAENPFLKDFYSDMRRWAFHSQVFFLASRAKAHRGLMGDPSSVVQDRSLYEDAEVFAKNLYLQGAMSEEEWTCYLELYQTIASILPPPDLVIYIRASV
jgi:deoxyadenosine/deoxycytidine kinase